MKSVDKALSEYIDSCGKTQGYSIEDFRTSMTSEDYTEFAELAAFVHLVEDSRYQKQDMELFQTLNKHKKAFYNNSSVANFRTERSQATDEAKKVIDSLFNEEFGNE